MNQETREQLIDKPVVGRAAAALLLPKQQQEEIRVLKETVARLQDQLTRTEERLACTEERLARAEEQILTSAGTADERWNAATATFDSLGEGIRGQEKRLEEERTERERAFDKGMSELLKDGERMSALRTELSLHNAVWGSRERLHISPDAYVYPCLMNTNSGEITVEEYTYAGPGVSLLAGTHDSRMTGFPRRDLTPGTGCDIHIGKGVWLCANCTVLGPCRIGNHAVIAAGAVVTPGTEVEPYAVYAGVPARKVREITPMTEEETAALQPEKRLFTRGWYTREPLADGTGVCTGRWMIRKEAEILLTDGHTALRYVYPPAEQVPNTVTVSAGDFTDRVPLERSGELRLPEGTTGTVRLSVDTLWVPDALTGNGDTRELGIFIY